jgi:voltage-gated potassium channel Kch
MTSQTRGPTPKQPFVERRIAHIATRRNVTMGLATTFVLFAFIGAVVIWLLDRHDFPTFGSAVWWALQTVTTVGYGDVVPKSREGRIIGGIEMVIGVSFISFLTAGVTSTVIHREDAERARVASMERERAVQMIMDAMAELRAAVADLDRRLDDLRSTPEG